MSKIIIGGISNNGSQAASSININVPQTSSPAPTAFTFKKLVNTMYKEDAYVDPKYIISNFNSKSQYQTLSVTNFFGTTATLTTPETHVLGVAISAASSGNFIRTGVYLDGTNKVVQVDLDTTATNTGKIGIGLIDASNTNRCAALIDLSSNAISAFVKVGATQTTPTTVSNGSNTSASGVKTIAAYFVQSFIFFHVVYVDGTVNDYIFNSVTTMNLASVATNLNYEFAVYVESGAGAISQTIKVITIGGPSAKSPQNHRQVQMMDGSPYIKNNKLYFTATCNWGGNISTYSIPQKLWATGFVGVFTLDIDTNAIERVGILNFERDGGYFSDSVAQIVLDATTGYFYINASTWGNNETQTGPFNVKIMLYVTDQYVLSGSHRLTGGTALELDSTFGFYDSALTKVNGVYYLACTQQIKATQNYYPSIWTSTNLTAWTQLMYDTTRANSEGSTIYRIGGVYYNLTTGFRAYDLLTGNYIGAITDPTTGNTGALPHPCLLQYMQDGKTKYKLLTFVLLSGNAMEKDVIYQTNQEATGYEFPITNMVR